MHVQITGIGLIKDRKIVAAYLINLQKSICCPFQIVGLSLFIKREICI